MDAMLLVPAEIQTRLAERFKALRLARNVRRASLAAMSGVPAPTIRRFELQGEISLKALVKLAYALGAADDLTGVFAPKSDEVLPSLDHVAASDRKSKRQRGRR
jgi:transcriptional regulator with XRE-family HTH domain